MTLLLLSQDSMKDDYLKTVKDKIRQFSIFLGEKKWFIGEDVCIIIMFHDKIMVFFFLH